MYASSSALASLVAAHFLLTESAIALKPSSPLPANAASASWSLKLAESPVHIPTSESLSIALNTPVRPSGADAAVKNSQPSNAER